MSHVSDTVVPRSEPERTDSEDFTTTLLVDQTPSEVFDAVTDVRGWWSEGIEGGTAQLDDEFIFQVEGVHYSKQKLIEVIPDSKVVWLITDSELTFLKDKSEWTGSRVIFEISQRGAKTQLVFTHEGLVPDVECYDACAPAWTQYVQNSLFSLITTSRGNPNLEGRLIEAIGPSTET